MTHGPIFPVYARQDVRFVRGSGARLYDADGTAYLDFISGIAVNALGHCHPALLQALNEQAGKLWHVSNMYRIEGQERLAARYVADSFADAVFFTNSGTEAIECALKTARRYHHAHSHPGKVTVIGFFGAFHGRSYAAINAAGNPRYLEGFGPALPGFVHVPFGDLNALQAAMDDSIAAVIVEPVQGESGVRALPVAHLSALRRLCDDHGALLIYDEVQCGAGRTGRLFAHEWAGDAAPDIMALAKGIGAGFPLGACLASSKAASGMVRGSHGSTYGGNPLAMAVGEAAWDILSDSGFLSGVRLVSAVLEEGLADLASRHSACVEEVRGKGLLRGLKVRADPSLLRRIACSHRLLIGSAGDSVIRLAPPLIVSEGEVAEALAALDATLRHID